MGKLLVILLSLALGACTENQYEKMSDQEIHARAQSMPLPQRYEFYLSVLESTIPSNPIVADDIALLGEPARKYVLNRALKGGREDLFNALPVLSAFKGECPEAAFNKLKEKARRVAINDKDIRAIDMHIMVACEMGTPPGLRNPWKHRTSGD